MGNKSSKPSKDKPQAQVIDLERGESTDARAPAPQPAQRRHKYNAPPPPPLQLPGQALEQDLEAGVGGYSSQQPRVKFPEVAPAPPPRKKNRGWFSFLKREAARSSELPPDVQILSKPATAQTTAHVKNSLASVTSNQPLSLNISASVPMAVGGGSTVCQVCGRWACITCDKCSSAAYCGKRCMLQHAAVHANICRQLAREKRAQAVVPELPEELRAVVETSCSMAQTAFALSGMVDPTFLVVRAAGSGNDTSMLEGLMQVEGFTSGGVPVTAFVILEEGGAASGRSGGDSGSRMSSARGSGASTPSRGWCVNVLPSLHYCNIRAGMPAASKAAARQRRPGGCTCSPPALPQRNM